MYGAGQGWSTTRGGSLIGGTGHTPGLTWRLLPCRRQRSDLLLRCCSGGGLGTGFRTIPSWRSARADESDGLENRCGR